MPRVKWSLPSTSLLQTSVLTSWPGYARIELKATGSVEGRFSCIASNAEGEVEDSIIVKGLSNYLFNISECEELKCMCKGINHLCLLFPKIDTLSTARDCKS